MVYVSGQISSVSNRSRSDAVRISNFVREPAAGLGRVEALWLWPRANFGMASLTLRGFRAC